MYLRYATLTALIAILAAFALDGPTASAQTPVTLVNVGGGCDHVNECPRAPTGTATPGPAEGEITLAWTGVGLVADRWRVGWRESGTLNFQSQFIDNVNARSFTITGLDSDKRYDVQVQGRATAGQGTDRMPRWGANARATNLRPPGPLTLVSNTGQSDDAEVNFTQDRAMGFRTGPATSGYRLSAVQLDMNIGNPSGTSPTYTVKLYSASASGDFPPDAALTTLTNPSTLSTGLNRFTKPGGFLLEPNKSYYIVFSVSSDAGANINGRLGTTNAGGESGEAGWFINDDYFHKARSATAWTIDSTQTPRFRVQGYIDGMPPAVQSAAVAFNTLTITFDERLDQDSVPPASSFSVGVTPGFSEPGDDPARQPAGARSIRLLGSPGVLPGEQSGVSISGSTVTLTLARAVEPGMAVTVSYTPPDSNPLRDDPGNEVAEFTDQPVTNNTPRNVKFGVIYEAVGGTDRVVRVQDGRCVHEIRTRGYSDYWRTHQTYGYDDCRRAVWNAYRASIGEEPIPKGGELPAGHPPDLNDFVCPSGWEQSIDYGQQWCAPRNSDMVALSPERAREFVRRGLRPSDETSTNQSRALAWYFFMTGPEACGEGRELAYSDGGNGPAGCTHVSELVNCTSGNHHGVSGRLCAAPPRDDSHHFRTVPDPATGGLKPAPNREDPTVRTGSTVSYTSSDTGDTGTQEYGTPGCMGSYWDDEKGGWVCY